MKEEFQRLELVNNESSRRFEVKVGEHTAFVEYSRSRNKVALLHTEVPPALEGQGLAAALVEKVLVYLESQQLALVPRCPYVQAFLKRRPEWQRLVVRAHQSLPGDAAAPKN